MAKLEYQTQSSEICFNLDKTQAVTKLYLGITQSTTKLKLRQTQNVTTQIKPKLKLSQISQNYKTQIMTHKLC